MTPTVTPRCCGSFVVDASVLVAGRAGVVEAPSTVFLVEAEETVLIDTGFGPLDLMADYHPSYDCHREPGQSLDAVLAAEGYDAGDVDAVVLSHLDWDHCYNLDRFDADTDVYVGRRELEYAIAPYPMHAERYDAKSLGRTPPWLTVDVTPIEGETEICPGVTAFPTPGHTVGHQSVAVETGGETTVVAVDAVPTFENAPDGDGDGLVRGLAMNDFEWWTSATEVLERADRLLPGHEWGILDADPAGLCEE
ncbi:N-acyl homoserine lactonase family protein [Haloplanus salilacus]|uniref:N-acyl homoserine lactonase family protein n=1 Tax=Haloplanus salilacus TaxID=2949994 RepID=UPI0030D2A8BE